MKSTDRPRILHVSGDFPDPITPDKTPVFRRLLQITEDDFDHQVVSINRTAPGALALATARLARGIEIQDEVSFDHGRAVRYSAPSHGVLHWTMLVRLGEWIADHFAQAFKPDLLVAHKLTIEGVAVAEAARRLGIPYAVILQGNTDCKIVNARPDLHGRFGDIYHGAAAVFALAPWTADFTKERFGPRATPPIVLPCPLGDSFPIAAPKARREAFLSAFNLRDYRNKNLSGMARAVELLERQCSGIRLRIAGGGDARSWRIAQSIVKPAPGIELLGSKTSEQLSSLMHDSLALVLPSRRESFGLVFVEALRSGCPVIYPEGAAIEGYLDDNSFAIPVDARNPRAIAQAMGKAASQQDRLKSDLLAWQDAGGLDRFSKAQIAGDFTKGLHSALGQ